MRNLKTNFDFGQWKINIHITDVNQKKEKSMHTITSVEKNNKENKDQS